MRAFRLGALLLSLASCAAPERAEPESRLVYLEHAPAAEVAAALRADLPPGVILDLLDLPGLNGILLRGSPEQCEALTAAIRRLDHPRGG